MDWFLYDRDLRHERVNHSYPTRLSKILSNNLILVETTKSLQKDPVILNYGINFYLKKN